MIYTEDHLVEQPAIQLMEHELGWDVVNCYDDPTSQTILRRGFERQELRRTGLNGGVSNQGRDGKPSSPPPSPRVWRSRRLRRPRREVVLTGRLKPALRRLNPDLPVGAIEGTVEEICRDFFLTALSLAEANREMDKLPSGNSKFKPEEVASMSDLMNGFQCFLGFYRLVKLAFLLKWNSVFTESAVSRMHESGDFV